VLEDLNGRVDLVLDGGPAPIGLESTVIDMTQPEPVVLRPGGVLLTELQKIIPTVQLSPKYLAMDGKMTSSSPGMLTKHYSPRANLLLFDGSLDVVMVAMVDTAQRFVANGKRVGVLAAEEEAPEFTELGVRIISLGRRDDLSQIARVLFGAIRALDAQGVDFILVRSFGQQGIGAAIWDRLIRAAEGRVIQVS
jgi:L-threonylcarbamoyladenylate synthase